MRVGASTLGAPKITIPPDVEPHRGDSREKGRKGQRDDVACLVVVVVDDTFLRFHAVLCALKVVARVIEILGSICD